MYVVFISRNELHRSIFVTGAGIIFVSFHVCSLMWCDIILLCTEYMLNVAHNINSTGLYMLVLSWGFYHYLCVRTIIMYILL